MRILLVYNDYKIRGGEWLSFTSERDSLADHGHAVETHTRSNDEVDRMNAVAAGSRAVWSPVDYKLVREKIQSHRVEVVHLHNFFPLISPAVFYAAAAENVPVVFTLHNYRLLCPSATFFRDGGVCEDCMGKAVPWPGVLHKCYRGNRMASFSVAAMLTAHRALGTWNRYVTRYIALTPFTKAKYIEGGLPEQKFVIKPNFLRNDPGYGRRDGRFALYIGRIEHEKGVETLIKAWESDPPEIPLKIAGDGSLLDVLQERTRENDNIELLGPQPRDRVFELLRSATVLLFPSNWYECLPFTLLEAFAIGTPVVVSKIGSIESMIEDGVTGLLAQPGDPYAFRDATKKVAVNPDLADSISRNGRTEFEQHYSEEPNYRRLIDVYNEVIHGKGTPASPS